MKVSYGHHGREALKGEFEGTSAIYDITPDFCPKPIAWGSFRDEEDAHFYVCKFYSFENGVKPKPRPFCEKLSRLHSCHKSPGGKFGFHCATYNGDLPQDNTWSDSWETFFDRGLRHVLAVREERAGPNPELESLLPDLFDKVIPRLLRPLETQGRKIEPSLVHGDLWFGNAAVIDDGTGSPLVYDPAAFWAHNECTWRFFRNRITSARSELSANIRPAEDELGNWRERRNRFDDNYSREYYNIIEPSDPVEDLDDRNALYAVRFNLHAAALFPNDKTDFLRL